MTQFERSGSIDANRDTQLDVILDSIATLVIQLDSSLHITRMNLAARRHFQLSDAETRSSHLSILVRSTAQSYLMDVCQRVLDSGNIENFEFDSILYPGRTVNVQVVPTSEGLVMTADVISQTVQVRRAYAASAAAAAAVDAIDILGRGRINIHGTITTASETLATLAKTTTDKIIGLRLPSLFDQDSRNAVRDAVETMLTTGEPLSVDANLLDGTKANTHVKLGGGVERDIGSITGAAFMVVAC
ncbi:MAG: PAS domain-containing protein [Sphingomonadales bacterium]